MSKSLWNVVNPVDVVEKYGRDALVYYLLIDNTIGSDGDFSLSRLEALFETNLIWWWGNLVSRVSNIAAKNGISHMYRDIAIFEQIFAKISSHNKLKHMLEAKDHNACKRYFDNAQLSLYLKDWYEIVQVCNETMQSEEPWKAIKDHDTKAKAENLIKTLLYIIKNLSILSSPFLVEWSKKIWEIFGITELESYTTHNHHNHVCRVIDTYDMQFSITPGIVYQKIEKKEE